MRRSSQLALIATSGLLRLDADWKMVTRVGRRAQRHTNWGRMKEVFDKGSYAFEFLGNEVPDSRAGEVIRFALIIIVSILILKYKCL